MTTAAAPTVVDLRSHDARDRWESVLAAFDALSPAESLVVLGNGDPGELLRRLQADRKGVFEWSPLGIGPSGYRVEVTRRGAEPGARRGLAEALAWDHDRLDELEGRAFRLFAAGDAADAGATWADFVFGLRRHIRFEEEILFPVFEEKTGFPSAHGPTGVMRVEHREIERLIEAIGRAFAGEGDARRPRADLHGLLGEHNLKEENVVYPGTDAGLDLEERDALVARIQAT